MGMEGPNNFSNELKAGSAKEVGGALMRNSVSIELKARA